MPEDVAKALKDILKGVCSFKGVTILDSETEPKLEIEVVNGVMESYRFTLLFRIVSIDDSQIQKLARCYHEIDPYPNGKHLRYIVCDDPPHPKELLRLVEGIFNDVEKLMVLHAFSPSMR